MQEVDAKVIVEAALLTAQRPLGFRELHALLGEQCSKEALKAALDALVADWAARGSLLLTETAAGWRFATAPAVRPHLEALHAERPQRYSRAVMETLAVIAYRQPVTRGDIEDIRGVAVGSPIIKQLEDRGWIDCIGHRDAPGRPALYATTRQFLDDLGLPGLSALPPLSAPDGTPLLPELPAQTALPLVDDDLLAQAEDSSACVEGASPPPAADVPSTAEAFSQPPEALPQEPSHS